MEQSPDDPDITGNEQADEEPADSSQGVSRRGLFALAAKVAGGVVTAVLAVPSLWAIIAPNYRVSKTRFTNAGPLGSLSPGKPKAIQFQEISEDMYLHQPVTHSVWVVKETDGTLKVFSPICTHLGCHYNYSASAGEFVCPCHGSVFSVDGKVLGGPAPRPLDTLPHKIENGDLLVKWERFKPGIAQKVRI